MLKAAILLVLLSLAAPAFAQQSPMRLQAPRLETEQVAPTRAAEPQVQAFSVPAPSFFDFLSSGGLANIARYCAAEPPDKANQWLHGFICGVRVTDVAIGVYMGLLVIVIVALVMVGVLQYDLFARGARQQLRAYVLVETALRVGGHDDHPEFQVVIKNFGQTPAHNLRQWINVRPGPVADFVRLPGPDRAAVEFSDAALGPGGTFELVRRYDFDWDPEGLDEFHSGKIAMYVYGEIQYRDAFRKRRHTKFRAVYAAENFRSGGLTISPRGNESD